MTKRMKILMIGLGGIGQRHARNLRALYGDSIALHAWRVRRQSAVLTDQLGLESATGLEEKYGIQVHSKLDVALAQAPDAVFLCNPSSMHIEPALAAARAGSHLFIEKPLSHDLRGVDELIDIVTRNKLVAMVAYQMRFNPCLVRVQQLLAANVIGRVLAVRAEVGEYLPSWHTYEDYRQMYAARSDMGGGVILSQIHEFDYLYLLFGMPRRVFALGGHLSSLDIDVEDTASILMDFSGVAVHLHQDYVQRPPSRTLQIIGDAGKIVADFRALEVRHFNAVGELAGLESHAGFERNSQFLDELKHFFACIDGSETPRVSLADGAQSLRMALAARQSLTSGKVIELT